MVLYNILIVLNEIVYKSMVINVIHLFSYYFHSIIISSIIKNNYKNKKKFIFIHRKYLSYVY